MANKVITITESQFKTLIKDVIKEVLNDRSLREGIDIDDVNMEVSYNPNHQNNVNTSIEDNPTCQSYNFTINGTNREIPVFSIFTRNDYTDKRNDGNPLIYALKGEKNWHFRSADDRNHIINQFREIATKFGQYFKGGATVVAPSESQLNPLIVSVMQEVNPSIVLYGDLLRKLSTEEVWELCIADNSPFRQMFASALEINFQRLRKYLERMDEEHNGAYARHLVPFPMRHAITRTMAATKDDYYISDFVKAVEGNPILIIDDSATTGKSLEEICEIIDSIAYPSQMVCLTLLSARKD